MHKTSLAVALVLSLVFSSLSFASQSPPQTKKQDARPATDKPSDAADEKADAAALQAKLQQRGIDLIKETGEEAAKLDDRRSAARIQAAAGDALWPFDKEAAQKLFRSAFEAALIYYREGRNEILDPITRLTGGTRADFCQEIIRRISSRDAALGHELAEAFNEEKQHGQDGNKRTKTRESHLWRGSDIDLSNGLDRAAGLLRTNQPAAIAAAQKIYSIGIPVGGLHFIWQLAMQDRAAADQLFLWLLANIQEDETADAGELQILAPYPFGEQVIWITNGIGGSASGSSIPGFIARGRDLGSEVLLIQWYIEVSYAVLSRIAASDLADFPDATSRLGAAAYLARWLEPRVAQARPELLPAWHDLVEQLFPRLLPNQQTNLAGMTKAEGEISDRWMLELTTRPKTEGTERIQQLLERAEKSAQLAQRDFLYQEAALEADRIGNQPWAIAITDKISDKDFRGQVRDWIYFNAATRAIGKNELGEARGYALEVKAPDQSASLFCAMARAALKEKDKGRAAELLTEAEQQTDKADNSPAKVRALLSLANLFVSFDPPHAFETMSSAVRVTNRVPNYSTEPSRMVRTLGNGAGQKHALIQNMESIDLGAALAALAATDFEGMLMLAQSLENKPLKLTAVIAVAASVLNKKPEAQAPSQKAKD